MSKNDPIFPETELTTETEENLTFFKKKTLLRYFVPLLLSSGAHQFLRKGFFPAVSTRVQHGCGMQS